MIENNDFNFLKDKYKVHITPGEKTTADLIIFLQNKFDIIYINPSLLTTPLSTYKYCALSSLRNQTLGFKENELTFLAFKLLKNEKSSRYYIPINGSIESEMIYILFETNTGYIDCNSELLKLELFVEQGISKLDYDDETLLLFAYLLNYDALKLKTRN